MASSSASRSAPQEGSAAARPKGWYGGDGLGALANASPLAQRAKAGFRFNARPEELYRRMFEEWRTRHGLEGGIHPTRIYAFADQVDAVEGLRARRNLGHVGLNVMAALLPEELAQSTGFFPLPHNATVMTGRSTQVYASGTGAPWRRGADQLPVSIDWTPHMSDVKIQGSCAGCWAFTTTGLIEGMWSIKRNFTISLSEQDLLSCDRTRNRGCSGGNFYWSLQDYASQHGTALESVFSYGSSQGCASCSRFILAGSHIDFIEGDDQSMMSALTNGPLAIAISAYQPTFIHYSQGIFADAKGCGQDVDHSVLLVGYGTSADGVPFWRIKNSWGVGWGEAGYMRMLRDGSNICGIYSQINALRDVTCLGTNTTCQSLASREFCTAYSGCLPQGNISLVSSVPDDNSNDLSPPQWFTTPMAIASCTIAMLMAMLIVVLLGWRWRQQRREPVAQSDDVAAEARKSGQAMSNASSVTVEPSWFAVHI